MKILIAEDDLTSRRVLDAVLTKWGYDVRAVEDGDAALREMQGPDAPKLAVLDWMMPGCDGIDVCRQLRESNSQNPPYVILLTARSAKPDIVEGLDAGANDYISKPINADELRARISVGRRVVELQTMLADRIAQLQGALSHIETLQGILPICMHCHRIRSDEASWQRIESYIENHLSVQFSHGLCDDCMEKHYPEDDDEDDEGGDAGKRCA